MSCQPNFSKEKRKVNYYIKRDIDCCATCKKGVLGYDGLECHMITYEDGPEYVTHLGICDKFEREKDEKKT